MGTLNTVTGPIPGDRLGITLAHEHLYCDLSGHSGRSDNCFLDVDGVCKDLAYYRKEGGASIIEMTTPGIGRSPERLLEISRKSGVNVVSGIGIYDSSTHPEWIRHADESSITDYFSKEIAEGTDGIRAGLIGELFSHNAAGCSAQEYELHEQEKLIFRAAAAAQHKTGVAIATHASIGRAGIAQLDVLERAKADLSKVAVGHCDAEWNEDETLDLEYYHAILERGAFCSFDMIGWTELMPDEIRADRIAALVGGGYAHRILLSMDTCRLSHLKSNGGRGYDFLLTRFVPLLESRGVASADIQAMLIRAPKALLERRVSDL